MTSPRTYPSRRTVDTLVCAALDSVRHGAPAPLPDRQARLRAVLRRHWLGGVIGTIGDAVPPSEQFSEAGRLLMEWGLSQLRPDRKAGLGDIGEDGWLHSTSWRPLLAMACHHGIIAVPAFPARYRRRPDEPAIENLCGLWAVGHSTVYRYLEKGRRLLAERFSSPPDAAQRLSLRQHVDAWLKHREQPSAGWTTWHLGQGTAALSAGEVADGLWHLWRGGHVEALLDALGRHATEAAASDETDLLLALLESGADLDTPTRFALRQRWALLWRYRHDSTREEEALQRALRMANDAGDAVMTGIAHAALARFHEPRDRDRAFASYEQAIDQLRHAIETATGDARQRAVHEYAEAIVRLAWLHLRRNNPRAKTLLDQVQRMGDDTSLPGDIVAPLEQTWGEYWRCVGDTHRALEHKHRALAVYERLGDQRAVLNTYRNLSLIYGEARDFDKALDYGQRVVDAAQALPLEPELLAGAHGNLGIAHFYRGDFDQAIQEYRQTVAIQESAGLRAHLGAAHYNLAEAHYKRFQKTHDQADEAEGDRHAAAAARISAEDNVPGLHQSARTLKHELLGSGDGPDRLLPAEHAAHFDEMTEIEHLRVSLAVPQPAERQVRTHLAIARAYLAIATKERETALALATRHGLQADFNAELDALRQTFSRELTREQQLAQAWGDRCADLLGQERRHSVLAHVLTQGSINKSAYAEVAAVSLATASKHLGLLAERGLLVQTGKGPSTRYLLSGPGG